MTLLEEEPPPFDFTPPELTEEDRPVLIADDPDEPVLHGQSEIHMPDIATRTPDFTVTGQSHSASRDASEDFGAGLEVASAPTDSHNAAARDAAALKSDSPPANAPETSAQSSETAESETAESKTAESKTAGKPRRRRRSRRGRKKTRGGPPQSGTGGDGTSP